MTANLFSSVDSKYYCYCCYDLLDLGFCRLWSAGKDTYQNLQKVFRKAYGPLRQHGLICINTPLLLCVRGRHFVKLYINEKINKNKLSNQKQNNGIEIISYQKCGHLFWTEYKLSHYMEPLSWNLRNRALAAFTNLMLYLESGIGLCSMKEKVASCMIGTETLPGNRQGQRL